MDEKDKAELERQKEAKWEKVARQSEIISWCLLAVSVLSILLTIVRIILRIVL